jgi:hypothetical protein
MMLPRDVHASEFVNRLLLRRWDREAWRNQSLERPCVQNEGVVSAYLSEIAGERAVTFEFKVTLDNLLTFVGLLFVAWQMRDATRQRKLETQIRLYDINRELISMGFEKPELFEVLNDAKKVNPTIERRYLQLWLNLLALIFTFHEAGGFKADYRECCEQDLRDTITMPNMRRHWLRYGKYYPASFRKSVDEILREAGQQGTEK